MKKHILKALILVVFIVCLSNQTKKKQYQTDILRDNNAQRKYREQSDSKNKGDQHVAHTYSLELAVHSINDRTSRIGRKEMEQIKTAINAGSNFKMRGVGTNLKLHRRVDNSLIEKAQSGTPLTQDEERRARMQAEEIMNNPLYPSSHVARAEQFYKRLVTKSGIPIWP